MITLTLNNELPLYEQLYRYIRQEIETGALVAGKKLPSKRKMANHLNISLKTVENAYAQLMVEGYIEGQERKAYLVRAIETPLAPTITKATTIRPFLPSTQATEHVLFDLKTNRINLENFPFSTWTKLMRTSLRDDRSRLLEPIHPQGDPDLRQAIAHYLKQFRSMNVDPEQIIVGAGTEYLLGLVSELLRGQTFAIEDPNYLKSAQVLRSRKAPFKSIPLDQEGISADLLKNSGANIAFVTPSHHFPLGIVMSVNRRLQLLHWAYQQQDRYLIENDYDSEYRFALKPIPPLHSLDHHDKVIYINTFTRTLAPSLRIAYLVLPPKLLEQYRKKLFFYSCTVSEIEQCTLWKFIEHGYYERHLSRIRTTYCTRRDAFIKNLSPLSEKIQIQGQEAGLHLLLTSKQNVPEHTLVSQAQQKAVKVYGLSGYYLDPPLKTSTVIVGYAGYGENDLAQAAHLLTEAWL